MIDDLASRCFAARDIAHREHWASKNYAAHVALGEFCSQLPGAIDALVKSFQGLYGPVGEFSVMVSESDDIMLTLQEDLEWMTAVREDICREDPALLSKLDAIAALYMQTIYKLENFT